MVNLFKKNPIKSIGFFLFQFFNYSSEVGFQNDILGFSSDWYGRLTGPFGNELVPGAYVSKFGLLGYLFFLFVKKTKYLNFFEISYLSLIGLVCFASGERMAFATYFLALLFLFIFTKILIKIFQKIENVDFLLLYLLGQQD